MEATDDLLNDFLIGQLTIDFLFSTPVDMSRKDLARIWLGNEMSNRPIPAAAEGAPFHREKHNPAGAALVRALPTEDLFVLYDAAQAISEAALSIINRPNCKGAVGGWLDAQTTTASDFCTYIAEELSRRPMSGCRTEDERRMGVVISWDLHECGCGAMEAIIKLSQMKEAHDSAAFEKRKAEKAAA